MKKTHKKEYEAVSLEITKSAVDVILASGDDPYKSDLGWTTDFIRGGGQ